MTSHTSISHTAPQPEIEFLTPAQLAAPLGPVPWLLRDLDLAPGAPTLLAGAGFSGKTLIAQALALAVAADLEHAWGSMQLTRGGRVVHLDYEQGHRLTAERYQRLARAARVDLAALPLSVAPHPSVRISDARAEETIAHVVDGSALVVVDSLAAATPGVDENSSEVRRSLDMLARVSERTGAAFVVLHHARKPTQNDVGGARTAIRGSGAIFDACSSVLVASPDATSGWIDVAHVKARNTGRCHEGLSVEIVDVEIDGDWRGGLLVRASVGLDTTVVNDLDSRVLLHVRRTPGITIGRLRDEVSGRKACVNAAVDRLLASGTLVESKGNRGARILNAPGVGA